MMTIKFTVHHPRTSFFNYYSNYIYKKANKNRSNSL